jgi:uncharacterized protein (DUF1697 family)
MNVVTLVALLRGVNVGGSRCKMALLKEIMLALQPVVDVQTYLQSGNVILNVEPRTKSEGIINITSLGDDIGMTINEHCGFKPAVFVITVEEYSNIIKTNPYINEANEDVKSVHLFFFPQDYILQPNALAAADELKTANEQCTFIGRTLFLHTPDGFGVSKLAKKVEKIFGSPATARNWRSVMNIFDLAKNMIVKEISNSEVIDVGTQDDASTHSSASASGRGSGSGSGSRKKQRITPPSPLQRSES